MVFPFLNPPPAIGCGDPGDPIEFACRFDTGQDLHRINAAVGDRRKWTFNCELKRAVLGQGMTLWGVDETVTGEYFGHIHINSNNQIEVVDYTNTVRARWVSKVALRDTASHLSLHVIVDTANDNPVDRVRVYIEDIRLQADAATVYPAQNLEMFLNTAGRHNIGSLLSNGSRSNYFRGPLSKLSVLDGIAVDPDVFGYRNSHGVWVRRNYDGAYGLTGVHLDFADPLDLGKDVSGNGNHFTATGLTVDNQVTDTPTNNFATLNPLSKTTYAGLSEGNLTLTPTAVGQDAIVGVTQLPRHDIYFECEVSQLVATSYGILVALDNSDGPVSGYRGLYGNIDGWAKQIDGSTTLLSGVPAAGDVIRIAYKYSTGEVWFGVNGGWFEGDPEAGTDPSATGIPLDVILKLYTYTNGGAIQLRLNFGQMAFDAPIPKGFGTLSSAAKPCPEILTPEDYVTSRVKLAGADVDDVWDMTIGKSLVMTFNLDTGECRVVDTVRGVGFAWETNTANAEIDNEAGGITAFTDGGFQVGNAAAYQGRRLDVMWRASPKSGMDIIGPIDHVTGTPTTVAQLTGGIVDMCLLIPLDGGDRRWYHRLVPGKYNRLNSSGDPVTDASGLSSTANTLTLGASLPSGRWMAYPFRAVPQFSAFPTYQGVANVNGAFVQTDFLPRLMLTDDIGTGVNGYPVLIDAALNPNNPGDKLIYTNTADGEVTALWGDFVSNGVKFRAANHPNGGYPYACGLWAQTPGKFARAR